MGFVRTGLSTRLFHAIQYDLRETLIIAAEMVTAFHFHHLKTLLSNWGQRLSFFSSDP